MKNHFPLHHALLLTVLSVGSLRADTFTVTRINNTGPGSLPVVISQANATPGNQTVEFAVSGTITLVAPLPTITNSLTINGRIDSLVVISGGGTTPVFTFAAGTTNILNQLTVANGNTSGSGAAVINAGTLFVTECRFINNAAQNGSGGAISNAGTMTIISSIISSNQAARGSAICNSGSLVITDSQLLGNQSGNYGAIFNLGQAQIERSTVSANTTVQGFGGGLFNDGRFTALSSTWSYNQALGASGLPGGRGGPACGGGGGGGGSGAFGGAICASSGFLMVTNCTIFGNSCQGGRGGDGGAADWGGPYRGGSGGDGGGPGGGAGGQGAQMDQQLATQGTPGAYGAGGGGGGGGSASDQSVADNYPYGRPGGSGGLGAGKGGKGGEGTNIIFHLFDFLVCTPGYGGDGGSGFGGGISCLGGSVFIVNSTVAQNSSLGGNGGASVGAGSAVQQGSNGIGVGGGIHNNNATVLLLNTVIADNTAPYTNLDVSGAFASGGYNLIGTNQGATGLSIYDYQDVPADLGPLQDNGGPTLTCALLQGSLAIGGGTSVGAPTTDQRGVPRPPGRCDIGAVNIVTVPILAGQFKNSLAGFSVSTILDSTNSYRIQGSTNLTTWIDLTNCSSGGSHRLIDTVTNLNRRFYRAVMP